MFGMNPESSKQQNIKEIKLIHLYNDPLCPFSHQARLILSIKDLNYKTQDSREDLLLINPQNETPVLVETSADKKKKKENLILTEMQIIFEFLEEHFPHPQVLPIEAIEKARLRSFVYSFDREIFTPLREMHNIKVENKTRKKSRALVLKENIGENLDKLSKIFLLENKKNKIEFLFNNDLSILDIKILPLIWRLDYYEINIPTSWKPMINYAENLFDTKEFINSLSMPERSLYPGWNKFTDAFNSKSITAIKRRMY